MTENKIAIVTAAGKVLIWGQTDSGAKFFPDVNTAAEAKRAVNRARFPPVGRRSVAGAQVDLTFTVLSRLNMTL